MTSHPTSAVRRRSSTLRNFSFLISGRLVGDFFNFLFFVLLSRRFGQEGVGIYSFAIGFTGMFAVLSELGANAFSVRELARLEESFEARYSEIFTLRVCMILPVALLLAAVLPWLPFAEETLYAVALVAAYNLSYQAVTGFASVLLARDLPRRASALEPSFRALTMLSAGVVVLAGGSLLWTLAVLPIAGLVGVAAAYTLMSVRIGRPGWVRSLPRLLETARNVVPYGVATLFIQVQQRLDVTFLALLLGAATAGVYNVAYRVVFLMLFLPHMIGLAALPIASRLHAAASPELGVLFSRLLNLVILLALPAAGGVMLIAPDLIPLVFGEEFDESVPLLRILAWLLFLACPRAILGVFLTACGRQADRTRCQFVALCAALALHLTLIPLFGMIGAVVTVLIIEVVLIVLFAIYLRREVGFPRVHGRLAIASIGTAAFVGVFELLPPQPIALVVAGSVLLYVATLLLFPSIRKVELQLLLELFQNQR